MSEYMDRQLEAYRRLRPQMLSNNENGWALVVHEKLVKVFADFGDAAVYADEHFPNDQVLIRHTAEQRGIVPFIVSAGEA